MVDGCLVPLAFGVLALEMSEVLPVDGLSDFLPEFTARGSPPRPCSRHTLPWMRVLLVPLLHLNLGQFAQHWWGWCGGGGPSKVWPRMIQ